MRLRVFVLSERLHDFFFLKRLRDLFCPKRLRDVFVPRGCMISSNQPTGPIRSSSRIVCLSVCLSVCLFVSFHVVDFEAYFTPTSRSRMSKSFRDSESLEKSAGKKGSQN